jgi:hypothetical protein
MITWSICEEGLLERRLTPLHQVLGHALELTPRELDVHVERTVGRGGDERQVDGGLHDLAEFDLRLLGRFL